MPPVSDNDESLDIVEEVKEEEDKFAKKEFVAWLKLVRKFFILRHVRFEHEEEDIKKVFNKECFEDLYEDINEINKNGLSSMFSTEDKKIKKFRDICMLLEQEIRRITT